MARRYVSLFVLVVLGIDAGFVTSGRTVDVLLATQIALIVATLGGAHFIRSKYLAVAVVREGNDLVIRNAFGSERVPIRAAQSGQWAPYRSGGVTFTLLVTSPEEGSQSVRVLGLDPADISEVGNLLHLGESNTL